jgi:hypothetical protein
MEVTELSGPALRQSLARDGLARDWAGPATRVELRVNDEGQFASALVDLGGLPDAAWVRAQVDLRNPRRASVCALPPGGVELLAMGARRETLRLGREAEPFLGRGWHEPEPDGFRWTAGTHADLLLPIADPGATRVRVRAMPLARPGENAPTLALEVNGGAAGAQAMRSGWSLYEWTVPASAWRAGANRVRLRVSEARRPRELGLGDDQRVLGAAVSGVSLRRD